MNKIDFFLLAFVMVPCFFTDDVFAHKQHVHQYFVREGYNLLKLYYGADIPQMVNHIHWQEG